MGFGNEIAPCGCNQCILYLPTVIRRSAKTRQRHRQQHGVPNDVIHDEDVIHVPAAGPLIAPRVEEKAAEEGVDMATLAKDMVLLISNHDVTWSAAEKIIKLVNEHVFGKRLEERIPATAYQLKKATACNPGHSKLLHVCRRCDFVFDAAQTECATCGTPPQRRVKRQVLVNDVGVRIKQMYATAAIAKVLIIVI